MQTKKLLQLSPFLILSILMCNTWGTIAISHHFITPSHLFALGLFIINLIFYFFKFRIAIILTGIFIILSIFNVIALFPDIKSESYFIKIGGKEISTPMIEWSSFFLLVIYIIVNVRYIFKRNNN
jgi:hypothetical protein